MGKAAGIRDKAGWLGALSVKTEFAHNLLSFAAMVDANSCEAVTTPGIELGSIKVYCALLKQELSKGGQHYPFITIVPSKRVLSGEILLNKGAKDDIMGVHVDLPVTAPNLATTTQLRAKPQFATADRHKCSPGRDAPADHR
jgi:hypothetical protein